MKNPFYAFQTSGSGCCSESAGSRVVLNSTCWLLCRIFSMIRSFAFLVIAKIGTATPACNSAFLPATSLIVFDAQEVTKSACRNKNLRILTVKSGNMDPEYNHIRIAIPDLFCLCGDCNGDRDVFEPHLVCPRYTSLSGQVPRVPCR